MSFARHFRPRLLGATALVCAGAAIGQVNGSYQATANPVNGSATVTTGSGTTNVQVNAATAVINWTPSPAPSGSASPVGPIQFQPGGTTATFFNNVGVGDYTVLNRIVPSNADRSIVFSGATNATVNGQPGGTLWFYSPGGIVLGAGASFNVGSLLLSTSDIAYNANAGTVDPAAASLLGTGSAVPFKASGTISVASGASITASNYVAMFAPRIQQDGNVTANGGVAYVAANAGTLTFPSANGLFSISIGDGTAPNDGNPEVLRHTGTTTGAVRNANSTGRSVYFVAVPKNVAITALLTGSIGYQQAAGVVTGVGDTVVLTSEAVTSGSTATDLSAPGAAGLSATVQNAAVRGDFYASAGSVALNAVSLNLPGALSFGGSARVQALASTINVTPGSTLNVAGDLLVNAFWGDTGSNPTRRAAGSADVSLAGATTIGRDFTIDASGKGAIGAGSSVTGGAIDLSVSGATLSVGAAGGALTLIARGTGSEGLVNVSSGDGYGGSIAVNLVDAVLNVGRAIGLDVSGYGGAAARPAPNPSPSPSGSPGFEISPAPGDFPAAAVGNGGDGNGGAISFTSSGTTHLRTTGLAAYARGYGGGAGANATGGVSGGGGYGGAIDIALGGISIIAPTLEFDAAGFGANGQDATGGDIVNGVYVPRRAGNGGYAEGGSIDVALDASVAADTISLTADATAGRGGSAFHAPNTTPPIGNSGQGGNGGVAEGGYVGLRVLSAGELVRGAQATGLTLAAGARGGAGGSSADANAGRGGNAFGGYITIDTNDGGGDLATPRLEANAIATGGSGGAAGGGDAYGGNAVGGEVSVSAGNGAIRTDTIVLSTVANRGIGQQRLVGSQTYATGNPGGGEARGGDVTIAAGSPDNGTAGTITGALSIDTYTLFQTPESTGSVSQGGSVRIQAQRGSNLAFSSARIDTRAATGDALASPGDAIGGVVRIDTDTGGAFSVSGTTAIDTRAIGGRNLGSGATGSDAQGGAVLGTTYLGGTIGFGSGTTINTSAVAGGHSAAAAGGYGASAGDVTFEASDGGGIRSLGAVSIDATAGYNRINALPYQGSVTGGTVRLAADSATLALGGLLTADTSARVVNGVAGDITIATSGDVSGLAPNVIAGAALNADGIGPSGALLGAIGRIAITNTTIGANAAGNNLLRFNGPLTAIALGTLIAGEGQGAGNGIVFQSDNARIRVDGIATLETSADVAITADRGGGIDFIDSATIDTRGFAPVHTNRPAGVYTIGGGDVAGSTLEITASDFLDATNGTTIFGNNVVLTGAGIDADAVTSRFAMTLTANGGAVNAGTLTAGTNLLVEADDDISIDRASGSRVTLDAGGAATILSDLATADFRGYTAGGDLRVNSGSGFGVTYAQVAGDLDLYSSNAIAIDDVATARNIAVSGTAITLGIASGPFPHSINATGSVAITARSGAITAQDNRINATVALSLKAATDISGAQFTVSTRTLTLDAGRDVYLGGGVSASGDLFLAAGRNVRFGSLSAARGISSLPSAGTGAIQLGGNFTVDGAAALNSPNTGGLSTSLRAPGGITLGGAATLGGNFALTLDAAGAPVVLNTITGTGATLIVRGSPITIGSLALGTADLDAGTGALTVTTNASADTLFARGGTVALNATGALDIDAGLARSGAFTATSAGPLSFTTISGATVNLTSGASMTGGSVTGLNGITLRANGDLTTTSLNAVNPARTPSPISVTSVTGALQLGTVTTDGAITGRAATGIGFNALNGGSIDLETVAGNIAAARIVAPSAVRLVAGGDVSISDELSSSGATLRGRRVLARNTNGALNVTSAVATGGDVTLSARDTLTITAGSATGAFGATSTAGGVNAGTLSSGGSLTLASAGNVTFTDLSGADIALTSNTGRIAGTRLAAIGTAGLTAAGQITVGRLESGNVTAQGSAISLTAPGAMQVTSVIADQAGIELASVGNLTVGSARARSYIDIASSTGVVTIGDARIDGGVQGQAAQPNAVVTNGAITVSAATSATLNGTVAATGPLSVTAATIAVNGATSGSTASFRSGAIALGGAASIASPGVVTFQNSGSQRTFLGGTGSSGYALSAAALQQVRSGGIAVIAPAVQNASSTGPDVTIGAMTLTGGAGASPVNLAAGAAFTVTTPGTIQVIGDVRIASADANNAFRFNAGQAIGITLPGGNLTVLDNAGNPAGTIDLTAPRITVATPSAAADILAATTTAARMARLATNDGAINDRGALAAGQLTLRVRDALYIQNTGGTARADRRGFSTGTAGFAVIATGTNQPEFIVNGRIGTSTGDTTLPVIRLSNAGNATGASLFVGASAANDCTLAQGCPAAPTPTPQPQPQPEVIPPLIVPVQDVVSFVIDDPEDSQAVEEALRVNPPTIQPPLIELAPAQPFSFAPPVDEPVTGSGNDSLWTGIGIGNAAEVNTPIGGALVTGTGIDRDGVAPASTGTGQDSADQPRQNPTPRP